MEKGADDYLVKPYTRDELIAAIDAQWNKHSIIERHVKEKIEEVGRNITYALPHEFRTVLNEVIGSAKYLNTSVDSITKEEINDLSIDIIASANRLLKITENFLVFVRIESFASNLERKKLLRTYRTDEPGALIHDFAFVVAERHGRVSDLFVENSEDSITIEVASESFNKIIDELIDNAFRFSEKDRQVTIHSWTDENYFHVSISDKGRGMTREQISSIAALAQFERAIYEQQGVGLGLIIAKRLVELHDGSFEIISHEGKGTTINFKLPCAK
jgi:two-component system sensor histidine kinase/response regulator